VRPAHVSAIRREVRQESVGKNDAEARLEWRRCVSRKGSGNIRREVDRQWNAGQRIKVKHERPTVSENR
jgi:hypothetical protein